MKNLFKLIGIIAVVAIVGFTMASCVTATSIGGAGGPHGFFTGNGAGSTVSEGATEVASYTVILGLFDSGYADYAAAVKAADEAGKKIVSTNTNYLGFAVKTTAYAQ
jgi:hypothetical protein